jgi:hypothetical protein
VVVVELFRVKVEPTFDVSSQLRQLLLGRARKLAQATRNACLCQPSCSSGRRRSARRNRFGFNEVKFTGQVGAPSKFTGLRTASAERQTSFDDRFDQSGAAMKMKFYDVFAGEAARRKKWNGEAAVDQAVNIAELYQLQTAITLKAAFPA